MSSEIRDLEILRVENGFVVFVGSTRMSTMDVNKWVANNIPDLLKVIEKLLSDQKET